MDKSPRPKERVQVREQIRDTYLQKLRSWKTDGLSQFSREEFQSSALTDGDANKKDEPKNSLGKIKKLESSENIIGKDGTWWRERVII